MERQPSDRKEKLAQNAAVILFLLYAVIGLFLFDDYGCGPDEGMERQTSLVTYKYVVHKLGIPVSEQNETWMAYLPDFKEYRDRYYGTALHFPLVLIEAACHFQLEPLQFYGMRHLYTFLNYFLGVFCLYRLLSSRFSSRFYGLAGMLLMILSPRFFAESFYNNKDVIFTAWYVVCAFLTDRWFQKRDLKSSLILAFALALTCNTRFNGIIFLPVFICLFLFDAIRKKSAAGWGQLILTLALFVLFFYLITPNFWESPLTTLTETLRFNMRHPNHGSDGNLFKGVLVDAARTLTYIPVWIAITLPSVYLLFTLVGSGWFLTDLFQDGIRKHLQGTSLSDVMMFVTGFGAVAFIVLTHVTIYNGWRHCYFSWPCFVYFAVYALFRINGKGIKPVRILCRGLLGLSILYSLGWIVINHPYEYVYFAPLFRNRPQDFSGDYWSVSSRALLEYITRTDQGRMLKINHSFSQAGSINRGLLPEEERTYLELTYEQTSDVDYYIVCRDDIPNVDVVPPGYEKVFSIIVDRDEIGAVFAKEK